MLHNDNVSMSVGHLDHVLIVHSLMEHVTWRSPGPMCGWVGRILHPDSCTSVSSWSIDPKCLFYPSGLSLWLSALCRPLLPCPSRWHFGTGRHRCVELSFTSNVQFSCCCSHQSVASPSLCLYRGSRRTFWAHFVMDARFSVLSKCWVNFRIEGFLLFDCFVCRQNVTRLKRFARYGHYTGEVEDIIITRFNQSINQSINQSV